MHKSSNGRFWAEAQMRSFNMVQKNDRFAELIANLSNHAATADPTGDKQEEQDKKERGEQARKSEPPRDGRGVNQRR